MSEKYRFRELDYHSLKNFSRKGAKAQSFDLRLTRGPGFAPLREKSFA